MLSLPEKPEFDHRSSILYFKVDNIQQATRLLPNAECEFIEQPLLVANGNYDLWMALPRFGRQPSGADERGSTLTLTSSFPCSCETAARGLVL